MSISSATPLGELAAWVRVVIITNAATVISRNEGRGAWGVVRPNVQTRGGMT